MRSFIILAIASVLLAASACESNLVPADDTNQLILSIVTWDIPATDIELNLKGPTQQTVLSVTFYIFGSNEDLGEGMVPLGHQRLAEQGFGPLGTGDELLDVDLTPWDAYTHIYVYNAGTNSGGTRRLSPGKRYEFQAEVSTN